MYIITQIIIDIPSKIQNYGIKWHLRGAYTKYIQREITHFSSRILSAHNLYYSIDKYLVHVKTLMNKILLTISLTAVLVAMTGMITVFGGTAQASPDSDTQHTYNSTNSTQSATGHTSGDYDDKEHHYGDYDDKEHHYGDYDDKEHHYGDYDDKEHHYGDYDDKEHHYGDKMMDYMMMDYMMMDYMMMGSDTYDMDWYEMFGTVSTTGYATASIPAERLVIQLGVETLESTAEDALASNSRLLNAAIAAIRVLGISEDEIHTSGIRIYPQYDYVYDESGRSSHVFLGYEVSNIITIDTDKLDLAANIIDNSVAAGINNVESISFTATHETKQGVYDSLLEDATANAIHKAEIVLIPLGYEIIGVDSVTINEGDKYSSPMRLANEALGVSESDTTPIFASDYTISVSVNVVFFIMEE